MFHGKRNKKYKIVGKPDMKCNKHKKALKPTPSICDKRWPDKSCLKCKKVDIFQQQKVRRFDVFCFLFLILDFKK